MEQSPNNTYQTIALFEQYFFSIRKQYFINTWNSDFSIVFIICNSKVSKVSDHSRGWPEGSLFDSYYTKV